MPRSPIHKYQPERHMWPAPANSYLLPDAGGAALVDAGCGFEKCYRELVRFLAGHGLEPADIHTVVLSHAHPDHMGAIPFLLAEASPRIWMHPLEQPLARDNSRLNDSFDMGHLRKYYSSRVDTAEGVDIIDYFSALCPMGAAVATDTMEEGDELELGGRYFEVIHTPGHAPGHVSLYDPGERVLLSGDVVGAVVAWYCPSGGGARGYLESLDRIERLEVALMMPSHGDDITDTAAAIERTRAFITSREARILELLAGGTRSLLDLTDELFPRETTRPFPGLQVTDSHLIKLEEDGLVVREEGDGTARFTLRRKG